MRQVTRRASLLRLLILVAGAALLSGTLLGCSHQGPAASSFYRPPALLPERTPGDVLRIEPLPKPPASAHGWRVLYRSTGLGGEPIAVSGVVYAPAGPPPAGGRPVVAWAHPTTGVATRCAPSLRTSQVAERIPGLALFLERGYVVTATDYPGLGTPGPHPYLVGESEARAVLDSVRAAMRMPETGAGSSFVVWGHSQGGHAALFTGQIAPRYAPELRLTGVVATAPATELAELLELDSATLAGKAVASMALVAWSRVYPDADFRRLVHRRAVPWMEAIARRCTEARVEVFLTAAEAEVLRLGFLRVQPETVEPWRSLFAANTPGRTPIAVPILITQGTVDDVVPLEITERFVTERCRAGAAITLRTYDGLGHYFIAQITAGETAAWVADRFAGRPAPAGCPGMR